MFAYSIVRSNAVVCLLSIILLASYVPKAYSLRQIDSAVISHSGPNSFTDLLQNPHLNLRYKRNVRQKRWYSGLLYSRPLSFDDAQILINQHNNYRRQVSATNMEQLFWDQNLANQAQAYAEMCDFSHSRNRVNTGENIWAASYSNWRNAVTLWFEETYYPQCACRDQFNHCCGHYTQVVWATTNRIGCGFAQCTNIANVGGLKNFILICQYQPAGNLIGMTGPLTAFRYQYEGKYACSECPQYAPECYDNLCVPKGYYKR